MQVRLHEDRLAAIDEWIAARGGDGDSRPQAIRELVDLGLSAEVVLKKVLLRLEEMLPAADPELARVIGDLRKLVQSTLK